MKIGIFGGGFDPPHLGHWQAVKKAVELGNLDEVWWMPYFKRNLPKKIQVNKNNKKKGEKIKKASPSERLEMVKLMVGKQKRFKVLDLEIKRRGVSYTINTIESLKQKFPKDNFYIIIGEDLLNELPYWKKIEDLKKMASFIIIKRDKVKSGKISSSHIRERIKKGLPFEKMVKKEVAEYIDKKRLYKLNN